MQRNDIVEISRPKRQWARIILPRIIFPPILIWDALKWVGNRLFGAWLGRVILPAQARKEDEQDLRDTTVANYLRNNASQQFSLVTADRLTIKTYDNAMLDTFVIKPRVEHRDPSNQEYIINFNGNFAFYENSLNQMEADATARNAVVIGFNYRNVSQSTGVLRSADDLVTDGIAQVQRLLNEGVAPANIILKTHSLGAGIATLVTKYFYDQGIQINLFHGQSFASLTDWVEGTVRLKQIPKEHRRSAEEPKFFQTGHIETGLGKFLGKIIRPIAAFFLALTKWEIDAARAYKALASHQKEYMVVRSSKAHHMLYAEKLLDDATIPHFASLHRALKSERRQLKKELATTLHINKKLSTSGDLLHARTHAELEQEYESTRNKMRRRKMNALHQREIGLDGHNLPYERLANRYNRGNANEFFKEFCDRVSVHKREALQKQPSI